MQVDKELQISLTEKFCIPFFGMLRGGRFGPRPTDVRWTTGENMGFTWATLSHPVFVRPRNGSAHIQRLCVATKLILIDVFHGRHRPPPRQAHLSWRGITRPLKHRRDQCGNLPALPGAGIGMLPLIITSSMILLCWW